MDEAKRLKTHPRDRAALINSLRSRKEELTTALKLDRSLRENKSIIETNLAIFESALSGSNTKEVNTKSDKYKKVFMIL